MSDERQSLDVRRLWQNQLDENTAMSLNDLRSRALKMNRVIRARSFVAGLAFLMFIGFFGVTLTWEVSTLVTRKDLVITECLFLIGAGFSLWQLMSLLGRARGKSQIQGEPSACVVFYRSELERQRRFYRRSAVWIPLAFSALWVWGLLLTQHLRLIMIVIWVLFVPFWVYQSVDTARGSQRELDKLRAISGQ